MSFAQSLTKVMQAKKAAINFPGHQALSTTLLGGITLIAMLLIWGAWRYPECLTNGEWHAAVGAWSALLAHVRFANGMSRWPFPVPWKSRLALLKVSILDLHLQNACASEVAQVRIFGINRHRCPCAPPIRSFRQNRSHWSARTVWDLSLPGGPHRRHRRTLSNGLVVYILFL